MDGNGNGHRDAPPPATGHRRALVFGALLTVLLVISGIVGFVSSRNIGQGDAERVDAERAAAAAAALDASVTRAARGLESMLSLLDAPPHTHPNDFDRFARGTVGAEDFTPTVSVEIAPDGSARITRAVMTGRDSELPGRRLPPEGELVRTLREPAATFGVAASRPTRFLGRRGLWFTGPYPARAVDAGSRFIASFVPGDRLSLTPGAAALVDGTTITGPPPGRATVMRGFEANGRRWAVAIPPEARTESSRLLPWLILAVAMILAALAAVATSRVLQGQSLARERVEQRVRVLTAAAEERGRLARDLHDSVSQALFSMTLQTRTAQLGAQREGIDPEGPIGRPLRELGDLTRGALAEIRALIFELRPQALGQEGFVVALQQHAAALSARERRVVEVTGPAHRVAVDERAEEQLFRVALEAVHNAVRHAEADRITVRVSMPDPAHVRVEISDDGRGFDPTLHFPGHFGLATMRERVEQIDGSLDITSAPGSGTTVTVDVPLTS